MVLVPLLVSLLLSGGVGWAQPSDTVLVEKEDEDLSPAQIALAISLLAPDPTAERVLIARDDDFADALASGVLQANAPLLLVPTAGPLPAEVVAEIDRLGADEALILGGTAAVSQAVEDELAALGLATQRRAGPDRIATAVRVADDAGEATTAILVRAFGDADDPTRAFADALGAGAMAARNGWPVLLTQTDALSPATAAWLEGSAVTEVTIVGGTAAVSDAVEDSVLALDIDTDRVAGDDRFGTAIAVAAKSDGSASAGDVAHVLLVDGVGDDAWAGGFASASRAAALRAPVVLARRAEDGLPGATRAWMEGNRAEFAGVRQLAGDPFLTCVNVALACEEARRALGLPPVGVAELVSAGADGQAAGGDAPATTPSGDVVAFMSTGEVVAGVADGLRHVYVVDDGLAELVDVTPSGEAGATGADQRTRAPDLSDDGTVVLFGSYDHDLGEPTGSAGGDVEFAYLRDLAAGETRLVSLTIDGQPGSGSSASLSGDGGVVTYLQQVDSGTLGHRLLHHDLASGVVRQMMSGGTYAQPVALEEEVVHEESADGRYSVLSTAVGLVPADTDATRDVYRYDWQTGTAELVSLPAPGGDDRTAADAGLALGLSGDANLVAWVSEAALVEGDDAAGALDVYLRDIAAGTTTLLSRSLPAVGAEGAGGPAISDDGAYVAFWSFNGMGDQEGAVFRHRIADGTVQAVDDGVVRSEPLHEVAVDDLGRVLVALREVTTPEDVNSDVDLYRLGG